MKLSRTVSYALRATLELAELDSDSPVPCSRLAASGGMPARFLLQVLRSLVARGILRSSRGVDGGYSLRRPPNRISLLELIEAIDGPLVPAMAPGDALPDYCRPKIERALADVAERVREELAAITLADLLPSGPQRAQQPELARSVAASHE
jgi:Rrf2 family protein